MLVVLAIINCLAFIFMAFALQNLSAKFRGIFLICALVPLVCAILVSLLTEHALLPVHDPLSFLGFLFRGWFVVCVASGAAGCYIATHIKADKR